MVFTLQQLNMLCQYSYGAGRADGLTTVGLHSFEASGMGSYWVLDSLYSPHNGCEGMITTPVEVEGQADLGHITVVFAGVNLNDDARNDMRAVLNVVNPSCLKRCSQLSDAEQLVQAAIKLATQHGYLSDTIMLTGHSLGGGLALAAAIRYDLRAVTFCALDPWRMLSSSERASVSTACAAGKLVDYRFSNDRLTGPLNQLLSGKDNRSAQVIRYGEGTNPFCHWLGDFVFDKNGDMLQQEESLANRGLQQRLTLLVSRMKHALLALTRIRKFSLLHR